MLFYHKLNMVAFAKKSVIEIINDYSSEILDILED